MNGCKLLVEPRLRLLSRFEGVSQIIWRKINKVVKIEILANGKFTKCSLYFLKCSLLAGQLNLITARAHKNKRTARKLGNARKDHPTPQNIRCDKFTLQPMQNRPF